MSITTLTAQIEDGILHLYPTSAFNRWYIKQDQDLEYSFVLYEFPEGGGQPQQVDTFWTAEQAVEAAMELT